MVVMQKSIKLTIISHAEFNAAPKQFDLDEFDSYSVGRVSINERTT